MHARTISRLLLALLVVAPGLVSRTDALSTAFTYQGQLRQGGSPTSGSCDFQFGLFDAVSAGMQVGTPQAANAVSVNGGLFTVQLDFGPAVFTGADRWLEIGVRCPAGMEPFTTLAPRQALTASPYALSSPILARDPNGNVRGGMDILDSGEGRIETFGPNGNSNVLISAVAGDPNNGFIGACDPQGRDRARMAVLSSGQGFVQTLGPNGTSNVLISSLQDHPENGFIGVADPNGTKARMFVDANGNGFIGVSDANGTAKAGILVDAEGKGQVFGDNKAFAVDYPGRPGTKIMYISLEGPEAAIFHRGAVRLVNGRATIQLPEHFVALANPDTITVQLTPGSLDSEGLAFRSIRDGRIEVGELHHGKGSYDVHFVVHAVRRGYEDHTPVLSAEEFRARFRGGAVGARSDTAASARAKAAMSPAGGAVE